MSVDAATKVDGLRILSLGEPPPGIYHEKPLTPRTDGGDLNSISQLKILEEFMKRLEYDSEVRKAIRPCEYFHTITGVGASG